MVSEDVVTTTPAPRRRRDFLVLGLIYAAAAVVLLIFAWPWLPRPEAGGESLARYVPMRDGDSWLSARHNAEGEVVAWISGNQVKLQVGRAMAADLRQAQRDAVKRFYLQPDETELSDEVFLARARDTQIFETRSRELDATGTLTNSTAIYLREPRGIYQVALYDATQDQDYIFDPPLHMFPAEVAPGAAWESKGMVAGVLAYHHQARVLDAGPFENNLGHFDDCLKIEIRFTLSSTGTTVSDESSQDWYCAGVGVVESQAFDAGGRPTVRVVTVGTDRFPADPSALPPSPAVAGGGQPVSSSGDLAPGNLESWSLTRLGRQGRVVSANNSTIPPVWIPTDPPALLAAANPGDLIAFDASNPTGSMLWRFHPEGTVYGPPAFDPTHGRIYFGASDKRFYALDARGLFLWAFKTGDNVATRPVVAGETVVFGSEDRNVYGVDATTGALRWTVETGGPVVSSPALVEDVVVIGSDDGAVYGLDPQTGEQRWLFATDDAIEAPIVAADGVVYVAGRDGTLYALDPASGEEIWAGSAGQVLRTAPAVGADRVVVVDDYGRVLAFDRETGQRLWATVEDSYVGPPVILDETLIVAGADGTVYRLDRDGSRQGEWTASDSSGAGLGLTGIDFGPTVGGGAIWIAADNAAVWRLGPGISGPAPLAVAWIANGTEAPFQTSLFSTSPLAYRDNILLVDENSSIYLVDSQSGRAARLGRASDEGAGSRVDSVVSGDTLLTILGDELYATRLPGGQPLWRAKGNGFSLLPVAVAGQTVLWLTQAGEVNRDGAGSATLYAIDLATGETRWEASLDGVIAAGGVAVYGETVFVGSPPSAFDLATGERRWRAEVEEMGIGGPVLSETGDTLFVGLFDPETEIGAVAAINTADGSIRWRARLQAEVLSIVESLWLSGETLIVPGLNGQILGLDAAGGAERWRYTPIAPRLGAVTVAEGWVWSILENGQVIALDAETGALAASFSDIELNLNGLGLAQRPLVLGDKVVVPLGLVLLALDLPR